MTPKNFNIFEKVFFLVLTFKVGRRRFNSLENKLQSQMCGINKALRVVIRPLPRGPILGL